MHMVPESVSQYKEVSSCRGPRFRGASPYVYVEKRAKDSMMLMSFVTFVQIFYFKMPDNIDVVTVAVATDSKRCAIVSVQNKTVSGSGIATFVDGLTVVIPWNWVL